MFNRSGMSLPHRIDILTQERTTSPSGQKQADWALEERVKCYYVPNRATIRVSPTNEETERVLIYFDTTSPITFTTRFRNITDSRGNEIPHFAGKVFEVVEINHFSSYSGKPHHMQVVAETVVE